MNLEQLRKQAKELTRAARAGDPPALARIGGLPPRLASAQLALAREHGYASWPALVGALLEHPFRTDVGYYEERADGIASVRGISTDEARRDLAARHGFRSWGALVRHITKLPRTTFVLAYRALEERDAPRLQQLLDRDPGLVHARGTNGNDLLGMAGTLELTLLLLERGADVNRGNDYGWTKLHSAGYGNDVDLARLLLEAGARTDLSARGDGGTPLVVALFWGHRGVVDLLGLEPRNLRVAAGLGRRDLVEDLVGTPAAAAHRCFYRPHGGFPRWEPSDDPQEVLDEALVWAARSGRMEVLDALLECGADVDADPYRGTALTWAAVNGHVETVRRLVELGAEPNRLGTFGGPDHGEGVTALHLAAQAGREGAVDALLALGADPTIRDALHGGDASGWAAFAGHDALAERLRGGA